MKRALLLGIMIAGISSPCWSQNLSLSQADKLQRAEECSTTENPLARLSCWDGVFKRVAARPPAPASTSNSAQETMARLRAQAEASAAERERRNAVAPPSTSSNPPTRFEQSIIQALTPPPPQVIPNADRYTQMPAVDIKVDKEVLRQRGAQFNSTGQGAVVGPLLFFAGSLFVNVDRIPREQHRILLEKCEGVTARCSVTIYGSMNPRASAAVDIVADYIVVNSF